MEIVDECYECILNRARGILDRSDFPENEQIELIENLKTTIILLTPDKTWLERTPKTICPAQLGTLRQLALESVGFGDTYHREKELGNSIGKYLISQINHKITDLKTTIMYSLFGNGIEFDVGGIYDELNQVNEENKLKTFLQNEILSENVNTIANNITQDLSNGDLILFFLDNVGEHYLDSLLINYLIQAGYQVEIVVKGKSVLNDFSIYDSIDLFQNLKIWNTGSSDVGIFLSRIPANLYNRIEQSKLLIIKGMAQFETLSSETLPSGALFLFKAKCDPVARAIGTENGNFIAHYQAAGTSWL